MAKLMRKWLDHVVFIFLAFHEENVLVLLALPRSEYFGQTFSAERENSIELTRDKRRVRQVAQYTHGRNV